MTITDYKNKVQELNSKYPTLNAEFKVSPFGGRFEIQVSTADKAKALNEIFYKYNFTTEFYK